MTDVTILLRKVAANDPSALNSLFELLYADIHQLAHLRLLDKGPLTLLDTTSLAHEAYLRLKNAGRIDADSRAHFMAYVSQVLRSVIVDFARRRNAERRGGGRPHVTLNTELGDGQAAGEEDVLRVEEALLELAETDPRLKQVVEMRYFGGLSEVEIAEALGVTDRTVRRDWERARMLLAVALRR
jgi:RNA polymerase sigma factor (TIGR02999 family)